MSVDGVRQDFVVAAPPAGAGDLRVELAVSGARAGLDAAVAQLVLEGSGRRLSYSRLHVADATGRELAARIEVSAPDRLAVVVADAAAIYPVRIDPTKIHWYIIATGITLHAPAPWTSSPEATVAGAFM